MNINLKNKFKIRNVVKFGQSIHDTFIIKVKNFNEKKKNIRSIKKK